MGKYSKLANNVVANAGDERFDASYGRYIEQMLETVEAGVYKTQYQNTKFRQWLPIKSDVAPGADAFAYYLLDQFGSADFVSDWSDEIPMVGVKMQKRIGQPWQIADGYAYSELDLRRAAFARVPLSTELADTAAQAIEEKLNEIALSGNAARGLPGFFNLPGITVLTTADHDNPATTGLQMVADARAAMSRVVLQSQGKFRATHLLVPYTTYEVWANTFLNTAGSERSVLQAIQSGNGSPIVVDWDIALETAGAGGTKRMVAYQRDPRVVQYVEVEAVNADAPFRSNPSVWKIILRAMSGGTILRQPLGIVYADGL